MLNSFVVQRFRLFRHLSITGLGRVNLVVGRNNAGKSAFLEAVQLYASNAAPRVLNELIVARQETWSGPTQSPDDQGLSHPVRHLFHGHTLPRPGDPGICIGPGETPDLLCLTTAAYRTEVLADGSFNRVRLDADEMDSDGAGVELSLVLVEGDRTYRLIRLDQPSFRVRYNLSPAEPRLPLQVVPTQNMEARLIASLWDAISLTDLEPEVIRGLQLLEPSITGVAFVESTRDTRIPLVKHRNIREPLPLRSMGEGMTRVFHIIVALVNARNGILVVDEFENGLHWTVQPKVWELVFRLAEELNVQIFATTHSRDCVFGFDAAWEQDLASGAFFRLNVEDGAHVSVTPYDRETLSDALDMAVEIR